MLQSWAHVRSPPTFHTSSLYISLSLTPSALFKVLNSATTLSSYSSWLWYTVRLSIFDCLFYCFYTAKFPVRARGFNRTCVRCKNMLHLQSFRCFIVVHFLFFCFCLSTRWHLCSEKSRHSSLSHSEDFIPPEWPVSFPLLIKNLFYAAWMEYVTALQRLQRTRQPDTPRWYFLNLLFISNKPNLFPCTFSTEERHLWKEKKIWKRKKKKKRWMHRSTAEGEMQ